ncbi:MAG: energy-coupling factor ABC transporter permease [Candidatus Omnitrophica bacterium]|nr:energy-coupling factor ABC transporter permease [Candidatus Omnitrophota bacterium]
MHIPDGFLSPPVFLSAWVISLGAVSLALKKTKKILKDKMVPLMGVMAAFIFAAQMLNFPVFGGTSGHLLGGILAAVTLGPYPAVLVLSLVLIVQCLIFQDGGITSLGANTLNMAVLGIIPAYLLYLVLKKILRNFVVAVFISSWFSVMSAALFCALELGFSGTSSFHIALAAMLFVHIFIGIGEAIITTFVLSFIVKLRPDLIYQAEK